MSRVKTAICLDPPLLARIDSLARELEVSRSRLLSLAAEEYLRRHERERMLAALDRAYADHPTPEESRWQAAMRERQRRHVERER